jgi:hypothetical protein
MPAAIPSSLRRFRATGKYFSEVKRYSTKMLVREGGFTRATKSVRFFNPMRFQINFLKLKLIDCFL